MFTYIRNLAFTGLLAAGGTFFAGDALPTDSIVTQAFNGDAVPAQVLGVPFQQDGEGTTDESTVTPPTAEEREAIHEFMKAYTQAEMADFLGLTAEELETAREDGTMIDILADSGLTQFQVQAAMRDAKEGAIDAAVDEGLLTEEQAEFMRNRRGGPGGPGHHGRHGRRGPGGPRGGGPGGPGAQGGPDAQGGPAGFNDFGG